MLATEYIKFICAIWVKAEFYQKWAFMLWKLWKAENGLLEAFVKEMWGNDLDYNDPIYSKSYICKLWVSGNAVSG